MKKLYFHDDRWWSFLVFMRQLRGSQKKVFKVINAKNYIFDTRNALCAPKLETTNHM